jgi:hypothetical protein
MTRVVVAVYVMWLLVGTWAVGSRPPGAWVTTRGLDANEQLEAGDVRWERTEGGGSSLGIGESPVGQHVRGPKRVGASLDRGDVTPIPELTFTSGGDVLWTFRPERQPDLLRPRFLRRRDRLRACIGASDSNCLAVRLVAVHHPVSASDSSFLVLALPAEETPWLGRFMASETSFLTVER